MKTSAHQRYKYTGDVYKFVRETVGDTSTVKYYFAGNVSIQVGNDKTQRTIIRCKQPFDLGTIITNIIDANGNPILDGKSWQINNLQPIYNSFGSVESYRMAATKYQGTI
jgi:hypothetical protein